MAFEYSKRVQRIPPYLFAQIEKIKAQKRAEGVDLIPLGIGDPDLPTPKFVIDALVEEARKDENHKYPSSEGEKDFREAVVRWMKGRFKVELDPATQVTCMVGSKEGIANVARAFVNPGDKVLCPDPAYPVYSQGATILCDGEPVYLPLLEKNGFLPDLEKAQAQAKGAKMIYLNYPNNPTGAVADAKFMQKAAEFSEKNELVYCYDNAYSEFTFDEYVSPSALEFSPKCIEFHSLSKTFNMTGDRIGFAVGDAALVGGLKKIKSNIDSGTPMYAQRAAIAALQSYSGAQPPKEVRENMNEYAKRRDALVDGLRQLGFNAKKPKATFYLWVPTGGTPSTEMAAKMLDVGVVATPGTGFGPTGEGYVRFALTQPIPRIKEALERMQTIF